MKKVLNKWKLFIIDNVYYKFDQWHKMIEYIISFMPTDNINYQSVPMSWIRIGAYEHLYDNNNIAMHSKQVHVVILSVITTVRWKSGIIRPVYKILLFAQIIK